MSIKVGDPAPPVTVEAYVRAEADPVTMELGRPGGSWTVLFFYPRDFTFVCPTELRGFAEFEADFALEGAAVVAASTDSWHVHRAWLETSPGLTGIRYPVIADPAAGAHPPLRRARLRRWLRHARDLHHRPVRDRAARERHGRQRRPQPGGDAADPEGAAHRRALPGVVEAGQPTLRVAA